MNPVELRNWLDKLVDDYQNDFDVYSPVELHYGDEIFQISDIGLHLSSTEVCALRFTIVNL